MSTQAKFKCMRCGNLFLATYSPKDPPVERSCSKCKSNSIRRLKEEKTAG